MFHYMPPEPDAADQILRQLKHQSRGMTISDLSRKTGIHRNLVSHHLEILLVSGKVELRTIGSAKVYSLARRVPLSAFLCFTRNMILVLDSRRRIVQVNNQCLKYLGRAQEDIVGTGIEDAALPVISSPEALAVIGELEGEQVITDLRFQANGRDRFLQMQVIPTTFDDGEKGCTLVLEDITERKVYLRNMEFLARTAMELVNLPPDADIHEYIADRISELVPGIRLFVDSYDENARQFVMRSIKDKAFREGLKQLVGRDVIGMTFRLADLSGAPHEGTVASFFMVQEHVFQPGNSREDWSFHDLCFRQIPREVCDGICSRFDIGKVIGISIIWQGHLFGVVGIFLPASGELENRQVIESFVRQASIALARQDAEKRYHEIEERLRETAGRTGPAGVR